MNELHLFAGAGGGILGGQLLGHKCICAVECEKYPRDVLLQRQRDGILPRFPIYHDVRTFDGKPWRGRVDVVCGGFPCQDISAAGKGVGIEGSRSGLWSEMHRIINEIRPKYAFVENSPMLVKRGLTRVIGDLAKIGYDAVWYIIGADNLGAPHQRKRIWIVAKNTRQGEISDSNCIRLERSRSEFKTARITGIRQEISDSNSTKYNVRLQRFRNEKENARARSSNNESEPEWWATEPNVGRVAHGVDARVDRLKAIGNGQVPIVAATAFKYLKQIIDEK